MAFEILSFNRYNTRIFATASTVNGTAATGAISDIVSANLSPAFALVSSGAGKIVTSSISTTKLGYLTDVTGPIQAQINAKQASLTIGNLAEVTSSVLTLSGGTGAIIGSGVTIQVKQATTMQSGYLLAADWTVFNNKLSTSLADGKILIGDGGGVATARTPSGDATISNLGAITIGSNFYKTGGTDVAIADGGTGASLSDPGFNALMGWDNTDNSVGFWSLGTGLSYNHATHTISVAASAALTDGSGTTENGSSVDLGGAVTTDGLIEIPDDELDELAVRIFSDGPTYESSVFVEVLSSNINDEGTETGRASLGIRSTTDSSAVYLSTVRSDVNEFQLKIFDTRAGALATGLEYDSAVVTTNWGADTVPNRAYNDARYWNATGDSTVSGLYETTNILIINGVLTTLTSAFFSIPTTASNNRVARIGSAGTTSSASGTIRTETDSDTDLSIVTVTTGTAAGSNQKGLIITSNADVEFVGGTYKFQGTAAQAAEIRIYEDTDDGTNYSAFKVGVQAGNVTYTLPTAAPAVNGYILSGLTTGVLSWIAPSSTVAGSDTQIQFNNSSAFGASADFTWDNSDKVLQVNGLIIYSDTTTDNGDNYIFSDFTPSTITTGVDNVGIGAGVLASVTAGFHNIAIGALTGSLIEDGEYNVMLSREAGTSITSGQGNICLGAFSGALIADGSRNTLLGHLAGGNITSGGNNVVVGTNIETQSATASGQLTIQNAIFGLDNVASAGTISDGVIGVYSTAAQGSWERAMFIGNMATQGTAITDGIVVYSKNSSDGSSNATLGLYLEQAPEASVLFTQSHRLKIWINGVEYYLGLDTV